MTLQQLEYIISLDKHKNFVRAAEHCKITQPTLSMQIQKLEDEIGFILFDRSLKPVQPTSLGYVFIEKARDILNQTDELKQLVSAKIESLEGDFRLGIIPTLAPYLLPLFLATFSKKNSLTHLTIEELQSEEIIQALKSNELDMALMSTPLGENSIREISLFREPFLIYLPEGDPLLDIEAVEGNTLKSDRLLLLEEGHCFRNQALNICELGEQGHKLNFEYQSGSIETLKRLVDKQMGYTLVPELSVLDETGSNSRIRRFRDPEPTREISLVCHRNFNRERLLEEIVKTIQDELPDSFKLGRQFVRVKWR